MGAELNCEVKILSFGTLLYIVERGAAQMEAKHDSANTNRIFIANALHDQLYDTVQCAFCDK